MKCKYCNKELPQINEGGRRICGCIKSEKEWSLGIEIQQLKKRLGELNKELGDLKKCSLIRQTENEK